MSNNQERELEREAVFRVYDFMQDYEINSLVGEVSDEYLAGYERALQYIKDHLKSVYNMSVA